MRPRILLICQAPKKRELYVNTLPPLGILGIASNLQRHNIPVDVLDYNIDTRKNLDVQNYDIIGFSVNMANISSSLESIRSIKTQNANVNIIVGGPSCISNPRYFTKNEDIDAVCAGEGEEAFLDYVLQESFINHKAVAGLYIKDKDGHFVYGGDREYIKDLDRLPFPALDKVDLKKYNVPIRKKSPVSSIMTSRGCPFRCIFCFHSMGDKWRARSPVHVVDEMEWQVKELGVREICVQDDNFSLDIQRAQKIFDLILERNIKVKLQFQNGLRVDRLDFALLDKMKRAGVWLIGVAPETGSPQVLKKINKNFDLEKVRQVVQWCQKIGINTYSYFMIGFPFEKRDDLEKTASFIKELNTDFIHVARVAPMPATPLYEWVAQEGVQNTFSQEQGLFYGAPRFSAPQIPDEEIESLIKQVHKTFYLNPVKIIRLMGILPFLHLIKLFFYSLKTRNI